MTSRLVYPRQGGLRFQIEVFLTSNPQLTFDATRAAIDDASVAVDNTELLGQETAGFDRLFDCEDGR